MSQAELNRLINRKVADLDRSHRSRLSLANDKSTMIDQLRKKYDTHVTHPEHTQHSRVLKIEKRLPRFFHYIPDLL